MVTGSLISGFRSAAQSVLADRQTSFLFRIHLCGFLIVRLDILSSLAVGHLVLVSEYAYVGFVSGDAVAFHGTADPWAETDAIVEACRERGIPLYQTEGANHSLETGDVRRDVDILKDTIQKIEAFIRKINT